VAAVKLKMMVLRLRVDLGAVAQVDTELLLEPQLQA